MDYTLDLPGGADAVLLGHGLCGNPLELIHLAKRLNQVGYTVRVPFIPGYGVSGKLTRIRAYRDWLTSFELEFDDLRGKHRTVSVGGLCIGATLALALAARRATQVDALLLISTTLFYDGWNVPITRKLLPLAYLPGIRHWYRHRETTPYGIKNLRLREWIADQMRSTGVSAAGAAHLPMTAIYQAQRLIWNARRTLPTVKAPTLILHAVEDDVAGPRSPRHVLATIGSADIELRWFHDSYHMLTIDNEKEDVARAAIEFLNTRTGDTRAKEAA